MKKYRLSIIEKYKLHKYGFVERDNIYVCEDSKPLTEEYIGGGEYGGCFKVGESTAFKTIGESFYYDIKKLTGLEIDGFVFPQKMIFKNDKFIGYFMHYVDGHTLFKSISYLLVTTYLRELKVFEQNVRRLSEKGIEAIDVYHDNMMIDKNGKFWAIDTDLYVLECHGDPTRQNLKFFSHVLLQQIVDIKDIQDGYYRLKNEKLNDMCLMAYNGLINPSELFEAILYEIECQSTNVDTIKDVKSSMRLLLK